ncbi:uncharacterized protein LOC127241892 [Andrographis paniculata]|uniref:uncharacterized protein LOC127241892 n=1 Tax=Andrographis paniculata TaxID=175694 RepID=UPI0021E92A22|nr:uncharacterized protein LOC127241892 [Andrographis paniculata]
MRLQDLQQGLSKGLESAIAQKSSQFFGKIGKEGDKVFNEIRLTCERKEDYCRGGTLFTSRSSTPGSCTSSCIAPSNPTSWCTYSSTWCTPTSSRNASAGRDS